MNTIITTGKALFIPRITGLDKYGRHSLSLIPDDQSIIDVVKEERNELLEMLDRQEDLTNAELQPSLPWKKVPNDKGMLSLGFTWNNQDVEEGYVVVVDQDHQPLDIADKAMMNAQFKLSFFLKPYCFTPWGTDVKVYGVKLKPRKIQLLSCQSFSEAMKPKEDEELVGAEF